MREGGTAEGGTAAGDTDAAATGELDPTLERLLGTDRDPLLRAILREVEWHYLDWTEAGGDADACGLRAAYQASSATIGRQVRVELPGDRILTGLATGVDASGQLQVRASDGDHVLSAGDVVHVRTDS